MLSLIFTYNVGPALPQPPVSACPALPCIALSPSLPPEWSILIAMVLRQKDLDQGTQSQDIFCFFCVFME